VSESSHENPPRRLWWILAGLTLRERPSWHECGALLLIVAALGSVVVPQRR
jgi:hypothetical protein